MTTRSRIAAAPGVRTGEGRGLRAALGASVGAVIADPQLWLLGALSFSVRGGVLVVLLPILWVPSPVLLSIFFGRYITTSGLSPEVAPLAAGAGALIVLGIIAAVVLAAYAQLTSFERVVSGEDTASLRGGRAPGPLARRERRGVILRLATLNLLGLVPLGVLVGTLGQRIGQVVVSELQFPTSLDMPFALTVLGRVRDELLILGMVAVLVDLLVSLAVYQLLAARFGVLPNGLVTSPEDPNAAPPTATGSHPNLRAALAGLNRLVRQPVRTLAIGFIAWLVTVAALVPIVAGAILGSEMLRAVLFRAATEPVQEELLLIGRLLALAVFGAIWVAGITLAGFASSLRGALWSTNTLH